MKTDKIILTLSGLLITLLLSGQGINQTDQSGKKQGEWRKLWPNGKVQYEGRFKNNLPVGKMIRYYESGVLQSVMEFTEDGSSAVATLYHPNGRIGARGNYSVQKKDGPWLFYSSEAEGYLVLQENYNMNVLNGQAIKYYRDSTVAETINWENGIKHGEWKQFYENGVPALQAFYVNGKLDGPFRTFKKSGSPDFTGAYKENLRDGLWVIHNDDGSVKSQLEYSLGQITDPEYYQRETEYFDLLEKNKGKIADPAETGTLIWK